jgi:hypothetical protein
VRNERKERALAEVTREARSESLREIDWDVVEAGLPMTRVKTLPPRAWSWRPALLVAAVGLTAFAVGVGLTHHEDAAATHTAVRSTPAAADAAPASAELDGDALAPGAKVAAGERSQRVVHHGHAIWTLAPHGSATLLTQGEVVAIRLDAGSVTSRVVKSSRVETFAVEAADVRIAAHGTEFVVTLGRDGVSVSVTEGSVLVGPREEPGTGELMPSPSAGHFTLEGKRLAPDTSNDGLAMLRARPANGAPTGDANNASSAEAAPDATAHETGSVAPIAPPKARQKLESSPAQAASGEAEDESLRLPEAPTPAAMAAATSEVVKLTATCFKQRTATSDGVRVTAQTTLTFRTQPDGSMRSITFDPPLSPWVQVCVNAGAGAIHSEPTRYGYQQSRIVDFER